MNVFFFQQRKRHSFCVTFLNQSILSAAHIFNEYSDSYLGLWTPCISQLRRWQCGFIWSDRYFSSFSPDWLDSLDTIWHGNFLGRWLHTSVLFYSTAEQSELQLVCSLCCRYILRAGNPLRYPKWSTIPFSWNYHEKPAIELWLLPPSFRWQLKHPKCPQDRWLSEQEPSCVIVASLYSFSRIPWVK